MTERIRPHGTCVICHGAPAPVIERSEVIQRSEITDLQGQESNHMGSSDLDSAARSLQAGQTLLAQGQAEAALPLLLAAWPVWTGNGAA